MQASEPVPLLDDAALACIKHLESHGALGVLVYGCEGCRIVRSFDPVNDHYEWHVSVSRDGKPVSWELAERFARELVPAVADWVRYEKGKHATHLWEAHHAS